MIKRSSEFDQNGLVSIMVASVLMVIMALITLGFTRTVQNEQRQAVDDQLSKQAFFAAESGINIAASTPGFPGSLKDDCDVDTDYNGGEISSGNTDIVFTCLLVNPTPKDIVFGNDSITTSKSKVVPIRTNPSAITLIFEWNDSSYDGVQAGCNTVSNLDFEANSASWDKIAPIKFDLLGVPTGTFDRNSLITYQFNGVFYPCDAASGQTSITYDSGRGSANVGKIIPVDCTNVGDYECRIEITGINPGLVLREHYARFNSIYNEANVRITALDSSGNQSQFANAQAIVDSTGKAVDVFRRLQARVPLYETYVTPNASIQTQDDICKIYDVLETSVVDHCN